MKERQSGERGREGERERDGDQTSKAKENGKKIELQCNLTIEDN